MRTSNDCLFCIETRSPEYARTFLGADWPYSDRLLFKNNAVYAVPGYSPQVYPYALILPHEHLYSMMSVQAPERRGALDCLQYLSQLSAYKHRKLYVFEHGGCTRSAHGNSCLEHAHFHVISEEINIFRRFALDHQLVPQSFTEEGEPFVSERYLFAGVFNGKSVDGFIAFTHFPERQYFRRIIAREIGDSRWNWRLGINEPLMAQLKASAVEYTDNGLG